ncbi:MAG: hypothetical protein Q8936_14185 [Bacillota bacterium]|nr:hypothetical protein [Bacillota bacterium]
MTTVKKHSNDRNEDMRIALLEQAIGNINQTLMRIESRLDRIEIRIDKLENRIWNNFYWMVGGFVSVLGLIAHVLDWI